MHVIPLAPLYVVIIVNQRISRLSYLRFYTIIWESMQGNHLTHFFHHVDKWPYDCLCGMLFFLTFKPCIVRRLCFQISVLTKGTTNLLCRKIKIWASTKLKNVDTPSWGPIKSYNYTYLFVHTCCTHVWWKSLCVHSNQLTYIYT